MTENNRRLSFLAFLLIFSFIIFNFFRELLPRSLFTTWNGWKFRDWAARFLELLLLVEEVVKRKPVLSLRYWCHYLRVKDWTVLKVSLGQEFPRTSRARSRISTEWAIYVRRHLEACHTRPRSNGPTKDFLLSNHAEPFLVRRQNSLQTLFSEFLLS